jgi:signal recognition particle receptor subunit beta
MNSPLKILVTGATGSGKTTFVQSLSDVEVVTTDEHTSELIGKSSTTVALDYGKLSVDDHPIHLFGTPGQERFAYMWETLSEGADGMILLMDATQEDAVERTQVLLDRIHSVRAGIPYVIGLTHTDLLNGNAPTEPPGPFDAAAHHASPVDARDANSSRQILTNLLEVVAA